MTALSTRVQKRSVVAVIGSTGVGKSQLAASLGHHLELIGEYRGAVILSADSMQLYKGLDVITNKVTDEERKGVEHWGLDVVQPGEGGSWEIGKWCSEAATKIDALPLTTLPIICGGTHYFVQHFLFPPKELSFERPREQQEARDKGPLTTRWIPPGPCPPIPTTMDPELRLLLDSFWLPNARYPVQTDADPASASGNLSSRPTLRSDHELLSLWRVLDSVDPDESKRWHWRDGRKVRRGIERWWERGGEKSQGPTSARGSDREAKFRTLVFWVYEPMESIRPRLDRRVDNMVEKGLLREIQELRDIAMQIYGSAEAIDHAEGIFQAIGYKEFSDLTLPQENPASDPKFPEMLNRMKLSTHQYAKSQVKWIKKQFLPAIREARALGGDVHLYVVPGGADGEAVAKRITSAFLRGQELPDPRTVGHPDASSLTQCLFESTSKIPDTSDRQVLNSRRSCEVCSEPNRPFSVKDVDWHEHLRSRRHRRLSKLGGLTKDEWIAEQRRRGQIKGNAGRTLGEGTSEALLRGPSSSPE